MHGLRTALAAASLLACHALLAGGAAAQSPAADALRPLDFLVGSCWTGTFPDGGATDEHCFEAVYDRQFVRDRHVVRGAPTPYAGETLYAWDAAAGRIVYWYIASSGAHSTGVAIPEGDALVFPETHVSEHGTRELRNVWRRTGPDGYRIEVTEAVPGGSRLLWTMEMKRSGASASR